MGVKRLRTASRSFLVLAVFVLMAATTYAATTSIKLEAESGALSGQATGADDMSASGGRYLSFNAAPQPGGQFQTAFDTATDFYNNFDYGYGGGFPLPGDASRPASWKADHDTNCGPDGTYRDAHFGQTRSDPSESFYWCSGHMHMTYFSYGMAALWMSPKQYFTNIKKVCSDISLTSLGGRISIHMIITNQSDIDLADARVNRFDLAFSPPGYQDLSGNSSSTGVVGTSNTAGLHYSGGWFTYWRGGNELGGVLGPYLPEDRVMGKLCGTDNGNGTITLSEQRSTGTVTETINGSFPSGSQQRVVWEILAHNPSKADDYDPNQNTYHIDNVLIQ